MQFLNWLFISSADPTKWSLTIKGFLLGVIPLVTTLLGLAHVQVGDLTPLVDGIVGLVQGSLTVVAIAVGLYGFIRKTYRSMTGQNVATQ